MDIPYGGQIAYRTHQVADQLGVSTDTVRAWVRSGRLRAKRPGRTILIPAEALEEFLRDAPSYPIRVA